MRDPDGHPPARASACCAGSDRPARHYVIASEPTAFDLIGAELVRDVAPGEMLIIDETGAAEPPRRSRSARKMCLFEYVYFARPDSQPRERQRLRGAQGARPPPRRGAAVRPARATWSSSRCRTPACRPRSASPSERGMPFEMGLIRSHYVGRTFIEPQQSIRHFGVRLKLNPNRAVHRAASASCVVDDSIVRGTTSRKIVQDGPRRRRARGAPAHLEPAHHSGLATTASTRRRARELIAVEPHWSRRSATLCHGRLARLPLARGPDRVGARPSSAAPRGRDPGSDSYCHACFSGRLPDPVLAEPAGSTSSGWWTEARGVDEAPAERAEDPRMTSGDARAMICSSSVPDARVRVRGEPPRRPSERGGA